MEQVTFGPFSGYTSSVERFNAPPDKLTAASSDVRRDPFTGGWLRRLGSSYVLSSDTSGMLEGGAKWSAVARQGLELASPSLSDGYPTASALFTKDSNSASFPTVDTGWFGQLSVHNTNGSDEWYPLLSDFSTSSYPTSGSTFNSVHRMVVPPLWYESGAGGYTRGAFAFSRRFLLPGSRRMIDSGNWRFFPNLRGTPLRWNREFNNVSGSATTNTVRVMPTGPIPPLFPPTVTAGTIASGVGVADTNWEAGDTFFVSVVYRFEDGSYSAPLIPRPRNATLDYGLGYVTIGTIASGVKYRDISWTNIPQPPAGVTDIILLRSEKQKLAAATDTLTLDIGALYPIGVVRPGQTSFTDTLGNDAALEAAPDIVRFDHVMPRRARYIGTGDQRVLVGHTLPSPHAIVLAPTGGTASRNINNLDDSATIYGSTQYLYRITTTTLDLAWATGPSDGTALVFGSSSITLSGKTLQEVVDLINDTTTASACKEWCAQLAPGVDGSLSATNLAPSSYTISITTTSSQSTVSTAASFADVPLGYKVAGSNIPAGTYVATKESATSLTLSANATGSHTASYEFYADTGDDTILDATGHAAQGWGWMRAYAASYPGFVYLKRSALPGYDKPDRTGVYFTTGSPGAASVGVSLAPNSWVRYNRRTPSFSCGNLLGFADIQGASVVAYSGGIAMFANVKGVNSGEDFDYKLFTVNPNRGCVGYGALAEGNGWAAYATMDGIIALDKGQSEIVLSNDIHNPATGAGSLAYELKTSSASARSSDRDADGMRMHLSVLGTQLSVQYRTDSGVTVPNRRLVYDFSPGIEASGLQQLVDSEARKPYGWSAPYTQTLGPCFTVTKSDDRHVCGVKEDYGSATTDGVLVRIDSGVNDFGSGFAGTAIMPTVLAPSFTRFSPQRLTIKHYAPSSGPTISLARNIGGTATSFNLTSGASVVNNELVPLTQSARTVCSLMELTWNASTVGSPELWQVAVEFRLCPKY